MYSLFSHITPVFLFSPLAYIHLLSIPFNIQTERVTMLRGYSGTRRNSESHKEGEKANDAGNALPAINEMDIHILPYFWITPPVREQQHHLRYLYALEMFFKTIRRRRRHLKDPRPNNPRPPPAPPPPPPSPPLPPSPTTPSSPPPPSPPPASTTFLRRRRNYSLRLWALRLKSRLKQLFCISTTTS
ncbi:hypothetical protein VTP01DRAFT_9141 [Rhizomucor pusillus]|uniref:uncharacterized protein n=1 Tax=Rhizomucor pusillus TaxID=4840 RepID=UPI003742B0A7